jgi:hypothetical protein
LVITKQPDAENYGFDVLVSICQDKKPTGRVFGIQLKAILSLKPFYQGKISANEIELNIKTFNPKYIPFPLYLFVFTMENDEGYYRRMNQAVLHPAVTDNNIFKMLTKEELNNIVEEVNLWYDKQIVTVGDKSPTPRRTIKFIPQPIRRNSSKLKVGDLDSEFLRRIGVQN